MGNKINWHLLLILIIGMPLSGISQDANIEILSDRLKDGDSIELSIFSINSYLYKPDVESKFLKATAHSGKVSWQLKTNEAFCVSINVKGEKLLGIIEPGDNVIITLTNKSRVFSGNGSLTFKIKHDRDSATALVSRPRNPYDYKTESVEDFLEWNRYLDKHLKAGLAIYNKYKSKISPASLRFLSALFVDQNIDDRSDKFTGLIHYIRYNSPGNENLCVIYDTAYWPSVKEPFSSISSYKYGNYKPVIFDSYRSQLFKQALTKKDELQRDIDWYINGINTYKGIQQQKFILEVLYKHLAKEYGFTPEIDSLYKEYYSSHPPEAFRKAVREKELKLRERINEKKSADFTIHDRNGMEFSSSRLKGKVAVLDFWFTGCAGCVPMAQVLRKIERDFITDSNLVFVKVSIDTHKEKWVKSIEQGKYTTEGGIHLYTGGLGMDHGIITQFGIDGYPELVVLDAEGRSIPSFKYTDPRKDNGKDLTLLLKKQLSVLNDGPYLFYEKDSLTAWFISGKNVITHRYPVSNIPEFKAESDQLRSFPVTTKKSLQTEKPVFEKPAKLIVLSDIEGNFDAFRRLLQANKIIDENYNWTFGNGHLVFAGDMFDRGEQVTECLWLVYSLEEKAKALGGYVHFVLGNHEIMNMQGDHTYAQDKYKRNAQLMNKSLTALYADDSELGRWLRTKNIIETIGDLLFVHGGIGVEFADSVSLSIGEVNQVFRDNMMKNIQYNDPDKNLRIIFSPLHSPFWYRLYYRDSDKHTQLVTDTSVKFTTIHPSMQQMDRILAKYKVNHIVTGHTLVMPGETISVHYGGKVINTDTRHAEGKSEALLIEGNNYYRVNDKGDKVLLFIDDKKKPSVP